MISVKINSQSIHNFEFVRTEPTTSQILFEILLPDCDSAILKITAEGVSNFIFYTYVLSSIYFLHIFQRLIINHHGAFSNQILPIIAIQLSSINYVVIYLHCVWDNLFRYLFNTLLGLPYGPSFFYPTPQHLTEVFLRISIYHPTSEGLDFWTKQLLLFAIELAILSISNCIIPWYEVQQERWRMSTDHLADKEFQIQAKANEWVKGECQNGDLDHRLSHISESLELRLEDNHRFEGKDDEYQALCSDISDVVEDLENIVSQTGDSSVSSAHDLDTLWGLIKRSKWGFESEEGVEETQSDEIDKEEWSILGESAVLEHQTREI